MRILFILHILVETLVGIAFLFNLGLPPEFLGGDGTFSMLLHMYGVAALSMGLYGLLVLINMHDHGLLRHSLLLFTGFHSGLAIVLLISYLQADPISLPMIILHGLLGLGFLFYFLKER